jgi:hypothetical protein
MGNRAARRGQGHFTSCYIFLLTTPDATPIDDQRKSTAGAKSVFFKRKQIDNRSIIEAATDRIIAERDFHEKAATKWAGIAASLERQLADARKFEADHIYMMTHLNGLLMETVNAEFVPDARALAKPTHAAGGDIMSPGIGIYDNFNDAGLADELDDALTDTADDIRAEMKV